MVLVSATRLVALMVVPQRGLGASASSVTFWALTWVLVTPVCSCCENPSCFIPEIDTIFRVCAELHLKV